MYPLVINKTQKRQHNDKPQVQQKQVVSTRINLASVAIYGKHEGQTIQWIKDNDSSYYQWAKDNNVLQKWSQYTPTLPTRPQVEKTNWVGYRWDETYIAVMLREVDQKTTPADRSWYEES